MYETDQAIANVIATLSHAVSLLHCVNNADSQKKNLLGAIDTLTAKLNPAKQDEASGE